MRLIGAEDRRLIDLAVKLKSVSGLLQAVSHKSVLERGYSITRLKDQSKVIRSISDVQPGERIVTQVRDGEFGSSVDPT
jgi:exonuclease VII large subunit